VATTATKIITREGLTTCLDPGRGWTITSWGRGDLLFWGKKEGPTVVIWESLSEQEKESWLEEASTMHDLVVWCKSKKESEEIRSFELRGKEIFFN